MGQENTEDWIGRRDDYIERLQAIGQVPDMSLSNPSGSMILFHAKSAGFTGRGADLPYAVLGMCTSGGGRTRRNLGGTILDDIWRPGRVGLVLPATGGDGFVPPMGMLGIGFDLEQLPACHGRKIAKDELVAATTRLFDDALASSVMTALAHDAELHNASTAFFEHGVSLVVHRLAELAGLAPKGTTYQPQDRRLRQAIDLISAHLDADLRVKDLAHATGLDPRSFTRAFKKETGYTPFAFITKKRMEASKVLLKSGLSVTETAASVGYANPAKFAGAFRRWVGASPSDWRKSKK